MVSGNERFAGRYCAFGLAAGASRLAGFMLAGLMFAASPLQAADVQPLMTMEVITWNGKAISIDQIKNYYRETTTKGIWTSDSGLSKAGKELTDLFKRSNEDGLEPGDYLSVIPAKQTKLSAQDAALFEMALSDAFLRYCRDLSAGRSSPSVTNSNIIIERKAADIAGWLDQARMEGPTKTSIALRPPHPQYQQLRKMLAGYAALAQRGGWPEISAGKVLKPGMNDPRVAELRNNLKARGYSGIDADDPNQFDSNVAQAVAHFQKRTGLGDDGFVGPTTLKMLNVPADIRVKQIIVNMERWRWLPRDLGSPHVLVNQAGFKLYLRQGEKVLDTRRVVVGQPYHQSPMFSDKIRYAEFNPTWTVPDSIATNEVAKHVRNDPGYLEKMHYLVYDSWAADAKPISPASINWSRVSATKSAYRIVQQPGDFNALGKVKFMFPNKFSVYLHDTSQRNLFSQPDRALSHGCIRVFEPMEFAQKLFAFGGNLPLEKMNQILASDKTTRVDLKKPIPIHLTYFTVWVSEDGVPSFFRDIYSRDEMVGRILFGSS